MAITKPGVTDYFTSDFSPSIDDALLASVAVRIQLTRSMHQRAVERYQTVGSFLDEHSLLIGAVDEISPQGSMAAGTTVSARGDEEFDIDLVADLGRDSSWRGASAAEILDNFFGVFRSSGRYRGLVERKTRCVTLNYSDGMHLDVTPLQPRDFEGHGVVMHHRHETRIADPAGIRVASTPKGFLEWFERQMPDEPAFAKFIESQALRYDRKMVLAKKADVQEVPDHEPAYQKPRAKICLQLIKRFRNLRYSNRDERSPPSVLLSMLVAETASGGAATSALLDELQRIVASTLDSFLAVHARGSLLKRYNPADELEELTDRWPETGRAQQLFIDDLIEMQTKLAQLRDAKLMEKGAILADLFGEVPAREAAKSVSNSIGEAIAAGKQGFATGGIASAVLPTQGAESQGFVPRRKDFFGGEG